MGMFDRIRCHVNIPGYGIRPDLEFQTKDLKCGLYTFIITSDGRLTDERGFLRRYSGGFLMRAFTDSSKASSIRGFYATFEAGRLVDLHASYDAADNDANASGRAAFKAGITQAENPYRASIDFEQWDEGWAEAQAESGTVNAD